MKEEEIPEVVAVLSLKIKKGLVPLEALLDLIHEEAECVTTIATNNECYTIHVQKATSMDELDEVTKLLHHVAALIKQLMLLYVIANS